MTPDANDKRERAIPDPSASTGEATLGMLMNSVPNPIFYRDADGVYRDCNRAFAQEVAGLPKSQIVGSSMSSLLERFPSDFAESYLRMDSDLLQNGGQLSCESPFRFADGSIRHVLFSKSCIVDKDGQPAGIVGVMIDMTRQKHIEDGLRRRWQEQELLLNNIQTQVWFMKDRITLGAVNQAFSRFIGKGAYDIQGTPLREHFRAEDADTLLECVGEVFDTAKVKTCDLWVSDRHERRRMLGIVLSPMVNRKGDVEYVICSADDVTERKETERKIFDLHERFHRVFEGNPTPMALNDLEDGRFVEVNSSLLALFGVKAHEIIGRTSDEVGLATTRDREAFVNRGREQGEVRSYELTAYARDGRAIEGLMSASRIAIGDREYLLSTFTDITEQKRAQRQLKLQGAALEAAANAIVITDREGEIQWVNAAFTSLTGYTREEARGQNPRVLKSGAHDDDYYRELWETVTAGKVWHGELTNKRKDGSLYVEEMTITPVPSPDGGVSHFIAIKQDVTDRKRDERDLQHAKESAEAANRELMEAAEKARRLAEEASAANKAKSAFVANMSHELRTPMNGIIGMADLLRDTSLDREQREYVETVTNCAHSLLDIINDILDFSKIESGKLETEVIDFDLSALLEDIGDLLSIRAHEKGLEYVSHVEPGTPTALRGDAGRIRQILTNLVGNAIKFTQSGEVMVQVERLRESEEFARLRFSVKDTGIGIPRDKWDTLFEPFTQADNTTTREFGGTGLGLTICKRLVETFGGEIGFDSQPGAGSIFRFELTLKRQTDGDAPREPAPERLDGLRCLAIDDSPGCRHVLHDWMRAWGVSCRIASDLESGMAEIVSAYQDREPFDALLLDAAMSSVDYDELLRQFRSDPVLKTIRPILLTPFGSKGQPPSLLRLPRASSVTKPLKPTQLLRRLSERGPERSDGPPDRTGNESPCTPKRMGGRILVVEDNLTNQRVATQLLKRLGHRCEVVSNGREAIETLKAERFHMVLMDVQMPVMDGFAATGAIRRGEADPANADIPIVAMTAHAMKGDREKCLDAGMDDYVSKPIEPSELSLVVRRHLKRRSHVLPLFEVCQVDGELRDCESTPECSQTMTTKETGDELAQPIFDQAALMRRLDNDAELVREIVAIYSDDLDGQLTRIDEAMAAGDGDEVRTRCHKLAGSSSNAGAMRLYICAHNAETAARDSDLAMARKWVERLGREARLFTQTVSEAA